MKVKLQRASDPDPARREIFLYQERLTMKTTSSAADSQWPVIGDIQAVKDDNAKTLVERADAMLKAQDDGLKAMEARMSSLFTQSITLASAAIAATATSFASIGAPVSSPAPPPWALAWVAQSLALLSAIWLMA